MIVIAQNNKSLFDIAIQYFGTAQAVFEVANQNLLSVTDQLTPGQEIELPEASEFQQKEIANYYAKNGIVPATADEPEGITTDEALEGIGAMIIEQTLIIE
ncbi:MAG: hypothetical protein PSN34_06245 [Urechidicola sp.]|nr:hypothetical protein [Urechidicola sp.]